MIAATLSRSLRTLFTLAAIGVALVMPLVSRNSQGDLVFGAKLSHNFNSGNQGKLGSLSVVATGPKLQEHNVLRLVDAVNIAYDERRRKKQDGVKKAPCHISLASKAEVKPLLSLPVERPAWITPDRREEPVFSFIRA